MQGDVKEILGTLMRVLDGAKISRDEVEDLAFDAGGELELQTALNEAYIKLLEVAYDCDAGLSPLELDDEMRGELKRCLDAVVRCSEPPSQRVESPESDR